MGQGQPQVGQDVTALMGGDTPSRGLITPGNVDLYAQPKVKNPDGSTSTVDSSSYNIDGREVLLPSVTPDGRHLKSANDIVNEYKKTGRHLGIFDSPASATTYAAQLHNDYAAGKYDAAPPVGADVSHLMGGAPPAARPTIGGRPAAQGTALTDYLSAPKLLDRSIDWLPTVGGAVGGLLGNIPGALLGGGAGEAYKELINRARGKEAPATPIAAAGNVAKASAVQGASQAVGMGIGAGMGKLGPWMMQSALKPTVAVLKEYKTTAPKLVQTLLDEGISVTEGGLAKLNTLFTATNDEIRAAVGAATGMIPKPRVAARALQTAATVSKQVNPTADLKAVGDTVGEFLNHPVMTGDLTVADAQAMKIGTYRQIAKKYGEVSSAAIETQKALARGLKEEVAAEVPEISALNEKDSALMAALDAVGRRVAMTGNKDPVGFAWVAHNPTTFLAALIDRNPAIKSLVARGLYQTAGTVAKVAPQLIRVAVHSLASEQPSEKGPD